MVKGNWQRRAELAAQRRDEDKARKAERRDRPKVQGASAESVVTRLRRDGNNDALVWLDVGDSASTGEESCRAWFRTGFCSAKKCRNAHGFSLQLHGRVVMRGAFGVDASSDGDETDSPTTERLVEPEPVPLEQLSSKLLRRVRFISLAKTGACVFDSSDAGAWEAHLAATAPLLLLPELRSLAIAEGEEEEDEGERDATGGGETVAGAGQDKLRATFTRVLLSKLGAQIILPRLLAFLPVREIFASFVLTCSGVKKAALGDAETRNRRRAFLGDVSGALSKERKLERKRRAKQAHIGASDKVDAYARGIAR